MIIAPIHQPLGTLQVAVAGWAGSRMQAISGKNQTFLAGLAWALESASGATKGRTASRPEPGRP